MTHLKHFISVGCLLLAPAGLLASTCPTNTLSINKICNANGQTLPCDVTIEEGSSISRAVFECDATNHGWISNSTIKAGATITGGILTGFIQNEGTLIDVEFRGASISGGTLSGTITIPENFAKQGLGKIKDVQLATGVQINGGLFEGEIVGDPNNPAILKNVIIKADTKLSGVSLGENVQLGNNVIIEENNGTTDETPVDETATDETPDDTTLLNIRYPKAGENVEVYWNNFDWSTLTTDEQTLWAQLGWNEASWQGDAEAPASETLSWDELSEMEQATATNLGYNAIAWDFTDVRSPEIGETVEAFWNRLDWSELTEEEQALWTQLGWDEASWQGDAEPPTSEALSWDDLSEMEQAIAVQLGYNALSWDFPDIRHPQIGENVEAYWNAFDWEALNEAEQALWTQLGWDENSWADEADPPASEETNWLDLSEDERAIATQLGYNQYIWTFADEKIETYWDNVDWLALTPQEERLWEQLGWDENSWVGETEQPASESKYWIQLTIAERAIAAQLGYDQQSWDSLDIHQSAEGDDLEEFWNEFAWDALNKDEQFLWEQLGWNAENWDGDAPEPASEDKDWEELTEIERAAAVQLGYDNIYWNSLENDEEPDLDEDSQESDDEDDEDSDEAEKKNSL